jgi:hypothetical protein
MKAKDLLLQLKERILKREITMNARKEIPFELVAHRKHQSLTQRYGQMEFNQNTGKA